MKRVLLTGAAGFLGSHCLRHLLMNTDWEIIAPVSFRHRGLPERVISALNNDDERWSTRWNRVDVIICDLAAPINDTTAARFGEINYVINFASESHVDRSISDPVPFVTNNVAVVLNLLEWARHNPVDAFMQISTDEVYGPAPVGYDCREWDAMIPSNPYSASKVAQEAIAISYWRTYGVPVSIINCMNLIGETQDPEKFIPMTIGKIMRGESVSIHASADGKIGSRFYLHARNLADAVLFLLRRQHVSDFYSDSVDRPDRWNVVGEREVDNLEMAQLVAKYLGLDLDYHFVDFHTSRPGHDLRYALDGSKLATTGWTRPIPFEDSLRRTVEWTLAHPLWLNRRGAG